MATTLVSSRGEPQPPFSSGLPAFALAAVSAGMFRQPQILGRLALSHHSGLCFSITISVTPLLPT